MEYPHNNYINTSSPKKIEKRIRLGRSLRLVDLEKENKNKVNIDLSNFSSEDEEVYNSTIMSPVRIEEPVHAGKVGEFGKAVEINEVKIYDNDSNNNNNPDIEMEVQANSTIQSVQSNHSEAETTIKRVKDFIEIKRKGLNETKRIVRESNKNGVNKSTEDSLNKEKKILDTHQKNLRRLIHRIHKQPYDEKWGITEWRLFQEYLNEWKLSDDDSMFQPIILQNLFNCYIDELEIRVRSLKKLKKWKKVRK
jgi:hypothetical protein